MNKRAEFVLTTALKIIFKFVFKNYQVLSVKFVKISFFRKRQSQSYEGSSSKLSKALKGTAIYVLGVSPGNLVNNIIQSRSSRTSTRCGLRV
jgi:hypothetical protein